MGHIPTKLHQFLTSSFPDFVRTDAQKHRQTDAGKTIPVRSIAGTQVKISKKKNKLLMLQFCRATHKLLTSDDLDFF